MAEWILYTLFICTLAMAESLVRDQSVTKTSNNEYMKYNELIEVLTTLQQRVDRLEKRDIDSQNEIRNLKQELAKKNGRTVELEEEFRLQKQELDKLKGIVSNMERHNIHKAEEILEKKEEITQRGEQGNDIEYYKEASDGVIIDKRLNPRFLTGNTSNANVAFFATLSKNTEHLGMEQNIQFDHLVTTHGNAYNPHDGTFVAPYDGTYAFSTTLTTLSSHTSNYGFALNGHRITAIWVNGADSNGDTSSQTIIIYLSQGDIVNVKHYGVDKSLSGYNFCTLSGFMLF